MSGIKEKKRSLYMVNISKCMTPPFVWVCNTASGCNLSTKFKKSKTNPWNYNPLCSRNGTNFKQHIQLISLKVLSLKIFYLTKVVT